MNKTQLDLLNLVTDLKRAVNYYVNSPRPNFSDCIFLKNFIKKFPKLAKHDPKIANFVDLGHIKTDHQSPQEKAEYLLMYSNCLQNYLLKKYYGQDSLSSSR